jgi:pyrroloquinoline-quinone synthase
MKFSARVKKAIVPWDLLTHPFYQAWNNGELKKETLKEYSAQYQKHIDAFPRYISATHSLCEDASKRSVLLENLNDEEGLKGKPHPLLWTQFAEATGNTSDSLASVVVCSSVKNIINTFLSNGRKSFEEGLASFYSYESQVPEIAQTKITGLKKHYGISSAEALEFFEVHKAADVHHRKACENLLDDLSTDTHTKALESAKSSAKALWDFLSEMQSFDSNVQAAS